jgi:lipoyl(octanoyl) transferase
VTPANPPIPWFLLKSPPGAASWNMALDEALFESAAELGRPVLRFYSWTERAATFGYSQRYAEIAQWTQLRPLIRRITGGGLVPHDADWTYSLVFPPGHLWYSLRAEESYRRLHEWVAKAFDGIKVPAQLSPCCAKELPGQCFAGAEKFDVLFGGKKLAGAAQKRNKLGLLIQGSVQPARNLLRADWEESMKLTQPEGWAAFHVADRILKRATELQNDKYSQSGHNERR